MFWAEQLTPGPFENLAQLALAENTGSMYFSSTEMSSLHHGALDLQRVRTRHTLRPGSGHTLRSMLQQS